MTEARVSAVVRAARVAAVVCAIGAASTLWVVFSGEREIAASTAELREGHAHEATQHAHRAASWYAPGAPHVRVAYERLIAIATRAEALGDRETAIFAWRAVRTAAIETKWIVTPHEADLARANEAIARLASLAPRPPGTRVDPPSEIQREELEALARDETPDTAWVIVLVGSAVAIALGFGFVVRRGMTATGQILWARAVPAFVVTAAGTVGWLLALWRA